MSNIKKVTYFTSFEMGDTFILDDRHGYELDGNEDLQPHVMKDVEPGTYRVYRVDIDGALPVECVVRETDALKTANEDELVSYFEQLFDEAELPPNVLDSHFVGEDLVAVPFNESPNTMLKFSAIANELSGVGRLPEEYLTTASPEDGESIYVHKSGDRVDAIFHDRGDIIPEMRYKVKRDIPVGIGRPSRLADDCMWYASVFGAGNADGIDDEPWITDREVIYLFGASPETRTYYMDARQSSLWGEPETNELYSWVGLEDGHSRLYIAPYESGMDGMRQMLDITREYIREHAMNKSLDVSDLDTDETQQL